MSRLRAFRLTLPQAKPSRIFEFQEILEAHRVMEANDVREELVVVARLTPPVSSPKVCAARLACCNDESFGADRYCIRPRHAKIGLRTAIVRGSKATRHLRGCQGLPPDRLAPGDLISPLWGHWPESSKGKNSGFVLAARAAFTGTGRPIPRSRSGAR
jgi:hypothetical protein